MDVARELADFTAGAVVCPHPELRSRQVIWVRPDRLIEPRLWLRHPLLALARLFQAPRSMGLCNLCRSELDRLSQGWAAGTVKRPEVVASMLELGYTERDAREFICDLEVA